MNIKLLSSWLMFKGVRVVNNKLEVIPGFEIIHVNQGDIVILAVSSQ